MTLFLLARALGPEEFGLYTGSVTLMSLLGILINLGLDLWLLQEGGRQPERIGELAGSVLVLRLTLGGAWFVMMYFVAAQIQSPTFSVPLMRLGAFLTWFNGMYYGLLAALKAVLRNKVSAFQEALYNISVLGVALILVANHAITAQNFLVWRIVIQALFLSLIIFYIKQQLGLTFSSEIIRLALRKFPPYLSSDFLATLFMRMDILLVSIFLTKKEVGLYSPAVGIINATFLIPSAVYIVIIPVISNLFIYNPQRAWQTARRNILVLGCVGLALFVGMIVFSKVATIFLGSAYKDIQPLLLLLSPVVLLHSLTYGMASVLVAAQLQVRRSWIQLIAVVVDGILNAYLLPRIGINGAAIAYLISEIVVVSGYTWIVYREYLHQKKSFV